jgi:long-chain acyl-CoA synthetase
MPLIERHIGHAAAFEISRHMILIAPITTSGTTGLPKLIAHTPTTLSAWVDSVSRNGIRPHDVAIIACPLVHTSGLMPSLAFLRFGAPIVLVERFDAEMVLDAIAAHYGSWMIMLPFMASEMTARQRARAHGVGSLRFCASVGDICPMDVQQGFSEVFSIPLHVIWGTNEAGGLVSGRRVGQTSRALPPIEVRIVDDSGSTVAGGNIGELQIRGPALAQGYWTGPGSIEDFTVDGWFPTGDLTREKDGDLWFVGRKKDLIIRGGSNISPVEVEDVLRTHPAVEDALVFGIPDPVLGQRVAALIQLVGKEAPRVVSDILASAKTQLADYKLPEEVKVVSEMPRNALGKIDRKAVLY